MFEWGGYSIDGKREFAEKRPGWGVPIHDLLVKHQISAVFHGHDHLFARQEIAGIVYFEIPQPSHPENRFAESAAEYGSVKGTILGSRGHVRVQVSADRAVVE